MKAHIALNVRDVERSIGFYRRLFSVEPCKVRPGYAKFDLSEPALNLSLNQADVRDKGALSHLGIQVESGEAVDRFRRRWADAGLFTKDEIETNCCYALQTKTWVADPDGNEWEAFVVLEDNLASTESMTPPECCAGDATLDQPVQISLQTV